MTLAPNSTNIASTQAPSDLLDALLGVFSAKGFEGASLAELSRACDRSKASLYHHFPGGKAEMIQVLKERCINDLDQHAFAHLRALATTKPSPEGRSEKVAWRALETFIDGFDDYLQAHNGHCLLATLALTQPDLLAPDTQRHLTDWQHLLRSLFEQLGHKPKRARRSAHALLARLYGSLTLAAMGTGVSTQQACELLKKDLQKDRKRDLRLNLRRGEHKKRT